MSRCDTFTNSTIYSIHRYYTEFVRSSRQRRGWCERGWLGWWCQGGRVATIPNTEFPRWVNLRRVYILAPDILEVLVPCQFLPNLGHWGVFTLIKWFWKANIINILNGVEGTWCSFWGHFIGKKAQEKVEPSLVKILFVGYPFVVVSTNSLQGRCSSVLILFSPLDHRLVHTSAKVSILMRVLVLYALAKLQ